MPGRTARAAPSRSSTTAAASCTSSGSSAPRRRGTTLLAELRRRRPGPEVLTAFLDVRADDATFARNQELVAATLGLHACDPVRAQRLFRETVWSPAANARSRELMAGC